MTIALFLGITLALTVLVLFAQWTKKATFQESIGLVLFGMALSLPFILLENTVFHVKYYFVIMAFIAIELVVLYLEHHVKYLHDLVHHNIKHLRLMSFFLIGIGFTYSELAFYLFSTHDGAEEILRLLPFKTVFALFMHTVLASAASLTTLAKSMTKNIYESVLRFSSYYLRIALISVSHYLYVFFTEHNVTLLLVPFIGMNVYGFMKYKKYLDTRLASY